MAHVCTGTGPEGALESRPSWARQRAEAAPGDGAQVGAPLEEDPDAPQDTAHTGLWRGTLPPAPRCHRELGTRALAFTTTLKRPAEATAQETPGPAEPPPVPFTF